MRRSRFIASASVLCVSFGLSNCATLDEQCGDRAWACVLAGVGIVAAVTYAATEDYGEGVGGSGTGSYSDARLKRDIRPAGRLPNGVKLYSFRYWNDARSFVGVLAQDLVADPRFRHAVTVDASGLYLVDLKALGLGVQGDSEAFRAAGVAAAAGYGS